MRLLGEVIPLPFLSYVVLFFSEFFLPDIFPYQFILFGADLFAFCQIG